MSVKTHNTEGWVLDTGSLIDRGYSRCIRFKDHKKTFVKCHFKKQCFNVCKSYGIVSSSAAADGGNTDVLQKTDKLTKVKTKQTKYSSSRYTSIEPVTLIHSDFMNMLK